VVLTDVSGQPIGPICRGQESFFLTPEDGADRLSRNAGKIFHNLLRKEERSSHIEHIQRKKVATGAQNERLFLNGKVTGGHKKCLPKHVKISVRYLTHSENLQVHCIILNTFLNSVNVSGRHNEHDLNSINM